MWFQFEECVGVESVFTAAVPRSCGSKVNTEQLKGKYLNLRLTGCLVIALQSQKVPFVRSFGFKPSNQTSNQVQ